MSPSDGESFEIGSPLDLQLAVLRSQRSALLQGATDLERSVVATIVSELGSNVLKYARRGTLELRRVRRGTGADVEIVVRDHGPGIADVELALKDHYSSGRTLGLGLPGVRRMADELDIAQTEGGGTTVRVRKRLSVSLATGAEGLSAWRPIGHDGPAWSAAAALRSRSGNLQGGDLALIVPRDDRLLLAIVDVTGHGAEAAALARLLVEGLRERFLATADPDDVADLLLGLHETCVGTVGAAAGLAVLDAGRDTFRYLAVGNVRAAVVASVPGPKRFTGVSRDGILGRRWPTPFVQTSHLEGGDVVLLWTDGLPESLGRSIVQQRDGDESPLAGSDANRVAEALLAAYAKDHDDAACLVARWRR
jgi:anti-sigma regulatory factor (Ser/Thr protein kinase)